VGLSHERSDVAGAEGFHSLEGNMRGTAMRGAVALPGSKATKTSVVSKSCNATSSRCAAWSCYRFRRIYSARRAAPGLDSEQL